MTDRSDNRAPGTANPTRRDDTLPMNPLDAALAPLHSRYDISALLGSCGMGKVYRARDRETNDVVAIKVLRPDIAADPAMTERFKNELRLARRITHKNVCRIYDFNRIGELAFITMEYVDGETLRAHLRRLAPLPLKTARELMLQIAAGLKEAHAQGVVHRDLKPENVMIATNTKPWSGCNARGSQVMPRRNLRWERCTNAAAASHETPRPRKCGTSVRPRPVMRSRAARWSGPKRDRGRVRNCLRCAEPLLLREIRGEVFHVLRRETGGERRHDGVFTLARFVIAQRLDQIIRVLTGEARELGIGAVAVFGVARNAGLGFLFTAGGVARARN